MSEDVFDRINDRLKFLAKKACESIGCSGLYPDLCQNHPQDCQIVHKIMGYNKEAIAKRREE